MVRSTDRLAMTIAVDLGRKATKQTNKNNVSARSIRALVGVIITLLTDSERILITKWLGPVINKPNASIGWKAIETPFYLQFKLYHFIYPHKETNIIIPKIDSENIACMKSYCCHGSHLGLLGETPIAFCLFDLILYVTSTIFQLNRDRSSWVEPVLS